MAAPKLESFRGNSTFDGSFRHGSMFDVSLRESIRDRLIPQQTRDYSYASCVSDDNTPIRCCSYRYFSDKITAVLKKLQDVLATAWQMGNSDPRKIIFSAKMGLALTLISILVFFKVPGSELGTHYLWAILTIVVVFEFSIGASFSKGFIRGLGTLSAGGLALGMSALSEMTGDWEEVFNAVSIFVVAFFGTYAKLYPTMKPYECGFRVFLLTYCYVTVSGYKTGELMDTVVSRFLMIALGAFVSLTVNTCIYPIWAGDDLHNLVAKNFLNVATSLEGCVNAYVDCVAYYRIPSQILVYEAVTNDPVYNGYISAVQSTSQEDKLMGFASWEPPHGPYKSFRYPWAMYVKVGAALRHCAFMVMALHGCIISEIQAAEDKRQVFRNELQWVGVEGAKVLKHIGEKLKKMEKLNPNVDILHEVHQAAEVLQSKVDKKSYLLVNVAHWEIGYRGQGLTEELEISNIDSDLTWSGQDLTEELKIPNLDSDPNRLLANTSQSYPPGYWDTVYPKHLIPAANQQPSWPSWISTTPESLLQPEHATNMYESASDLSLATFASLLIEFVARLENLVDAYTELCEKANFKESAVSDF